MDKTAIIILAEGFEEIEAISVIDILRRSNIDISICGLKDKKIKGSHDITILADKELGDTLQDYDCLILPGGMPGASNLATSEKVTNLIKIMHKKGKIIAAICASPAVVLAPAGILNNKNATCYPGMEDGFDKTTTCKNEDVVIDGNIITSKGPATAVPFALAIAEKLSGKETAQRVKKALLSQ